MPSQIPCIKYRIQPSDPSKFACSNTKASRFWLHCLNYENIQLKNARKFTNIFLFPKGKWVSVKKKQWLAHLFMLSFHLQWCQSANTIYIKYILKISNCKDFNS